MKQLLLYILTNILEENVPIEVTEEEQDGVVTLMVSVPKDQVGKVIGKSGKIINSIKNILKIKAIKEQKKIEIKILEQE